MTAIVAAGVDDLAPAAGQELTDNDMNITTMDETSVRTLGYDARTGTLATRADINLINRPRAGRLPRKGNVSARAMRRAQERAARKGGA